MKRITKLKLDEANRFEQLGGLTRVSLENIPAEYISAPDFYLQQRSSELMADVVGIPRDVKEQFVFYRTNLARVMEMAA
jgi:hypothetical protein